LGSPDGGGHLRDRAADAPSFQTVQALRARFGHRHRTGTAALRSPPVVPAPCSPRRRLVHLRRNAAPQMDAVWKSIILKSNIARWLILLLLPKVK